MKYGNYLISVDRFLFMGLKANKADTYSLFHIEFSSSSTNLTESKQVHCMKEYLIHFFFQNVDCTRSKAMVGILVRVAFAYLWA